MNLFKRSIISIIKNWLKALIFLGLVSLLGMILASVIIINQGINQTAEHIRLSVPMVVTARIDETAALQYHTPEEIWSGNRPFESITIEIVEEIGRLSYVRGFDYSIGWSANSYFEEYVPEVEEGLEHLRENRISSIGQWDMRFFWLQGVSRPNLIYTEAGHFNLIAGREFTESEINSPNNDLPTPVLIPNSIAQLNDLSVGSVFNLYGGRSEILESAVIPEGGITGFEWEEVWTHPYVASIEEIHPFEVIGIVELNFNPARNEEEFFLQLVTHNSFFIPNWKTEEISLSAVEGLNEIYATFNLDDVAFMSDLYVFWILDDPLYLNAFTEAAEELLPEFYRIEGFPYIFDPLEAAMGTLGSIMNQAFIFVTIAGLIVLSLLILLYLRDRRHELGIYLALGEKKSKIVFQILIEVMLVAGIGMVVANASGNIIASNISQRLLIQEITDGWSVSAQHGMGSGIPSRLEFVGLVRDLSGDELVELFDTSFDVQTIVIFYAAGLTTIMLSTIVPTVYIIKLSPKEILTQSKIG